MTTSANRRFRMEPVDGINPVDGWSLWTWDEGDGDRFWTPAYTACRGDEEIDLHHSRFHFSPSQDRFAWLVRNGFPRPAVGCWDDTMLEAAMAAESVAA